jgi:hypothetical protein
MLSRTAAATGDGSDAELAVQGLVVSRGAVMFGATPRPTSPMIFSRPLLAPASTLTRARMPGGRIRIAVGQVLRGEPFHAGHRDDASGDAV